MIIKKKIDLNHSFIKLKLKIDYFSITLYYSDYKQLKNWIKMQEANDFSFTYNFEDKYANKSDDIISVRKETNTFRFSTKNFSFLFYSNEISNELQSLYDWIKKAKQFKSI